VFGRQVLSVLQYLGDLRPPVIHRDIKVIIFVTRGCLCFFPDLESFDGAALLDFWSCWFLCINIFTCWTPIPSRGSGSCFTVFLHKWTTDTLFVVHCSQPENIILDEETGNVKIVDFGAVQDVASSTLIGSTVVGTVRISCSE